MDEEEKARIRNLYEVFYDVQDVRIRSYNRLRQVFRAKAVSDFESQYKRKPTREEMKEINKRLLKEFSERTGIHPEIQLLLEKQIREYIKVEVRDVPIVKTFLRNVKGIGPCLAGGIISYFDPRGSEKHPADHASSFWKYAGLDPNAPKRTRGEKLPYNPKVKVLCWKIAESFIKQRTPFYREIYDERKPVEEAKLGYPVERASLYDPVLGTEIAKTVNHPEKCPLFPDKCFAYQRMCSAYQRKLQNGKRKDKKFSLSQVPCGKHIDYRAKRPMVKRFLADLWATWRRLENLSVTAPYAVAVLGHDKDEPARVQ